METAVMPGEGGSDLDRAQEADAPRDDLDRLEGARELRAGMGGHERRADQGTAGWRGRGDHAVDEDARLVKLLHHGERDAVFSDDDRHDGRLRVARVQPERLQALEE